MCINRKPFLIICDYLKTSLTLNQKKGPDPLSNIMYVNLINTDIA
jgi:hypothetical protein